MPAKNQLNYEEVKASHIQEALISRIYGIPLGFQTRSAGVIGGCIPVIFCLCVHDSPSSPCPCKKIIWLPKDKILKSEPTDRRNSDGNEIHSFELQNDAKVVVETTLQLNVQGLAALSESGKEKSSATQVLSKKLAPKDWVGLSFAFGYWLGGKLDEELDLSDKISDWLLDTFGPLDL